MYAATVYAAAAAAAAAVWVTSNIQSCVLFLQDNLTWAQVWEHALQEEVQITTVLRMLLDDAHTSVVTAAAQALAVLVGPGREEEECWQAADDNPATGRVCVTPSQVTSESTQVKQVESGAKRAELLPAG